MKTRIISGIILLPLLLLLVIGGTPLYVAEIIMISIAMHEFYYAFEAKDIKPIYLLGYIFAAYLGVKHILGLPAAAIYIMTYVLFVVAIIYMLSGKKNIIDVSVTFSGFFYVGIFFDCVIATKNGLANGDIYVWLIFIIAFATDIFAYFSGYFFGKHKLIPSVSPKKTIEGSIGGILGSTVGCMIFGHFFGLDIVHMLVIGLTGSIIAQFGDLFASSIKRYVGIKDYGKLIPGHGGVLDRFDSVILVAPFVYNAIKLFGM